MKIKKYKYQADGVILLENDIFNKGEGIIIRMMDGNLGIQVAEDGRIWICIDGISFIRFQPTSKLKRSKK